MSAREVAVLRQHQARGIALAAALRDLRERGVRTVNVTALRLRWTRERASLAALYGGAVPYVNGN